VLEAPIQGLVHGLKYHDRFDHARLLGSLMAEALVRREVEMPDVVIPVPLHWRRLMKRGYNQAAVLAAAIARVVPVPVEMSCAHRVRETADQIGMDAAARRRNVEGAFEVRRDLSGLRVALLDDVMTTGATLGALAAAAREAGADWVEVWAAARVA
jgi:ComF family protein